MRFWRKKKRTFTGILVTALSRYLAQAQKGNLPFGLYILQVTQSELIEGGISASLPGHVVGYQTFARNRRYVGLLPEQTDEQILEVRKTIQQTAQNLTWGNVEIGLARWPVDGRAAKDLLGWANFDLQRQVRASRADQMLEKNGHGAGGARNEYHHAKEITAAGKKRQRSPIGRFLIERGYITEEQINHALQVQRSKHISLGGLSLQEGLLDETQVLDVLFRQEETGELFGEAGQHLGLLSERQVKNLLDIQRRNLPPLGQILKQLGYISAGQLAEAVDDLSRMLETTAPTAG